jgi:hypothetical protein
MAKSNVVEFDESRLTQTDPVARMIEKNVLTGIDEINKINSVLLAEESGTPVRDIDKALKAEAEKENSDLDAQTLADYREAQAAYATYRTLVENSRNAYRKNVLGEEEKSEGSVSDEDKTRAQEVRKTVNDAVKFVLSYAQGNGNADVLAWAQSVEVPQVGRQGTSSVGQTKPRVFVFIDGSDTPENSLTDAAKKLSDKDNKVVAGDLAKAWNTANGGVEGEFKFGEHVLRVTAKPKKSDG